MPAWNLALRWLGILPHRPILMREAKTKLGDLMTRFRVRCGKDGTEIVENDVILLWLDPPRIVTGTDILGRLLRKIAHPVSTLESHD